MYIKSSHNSISVKPTTQFLKCLFCSVLSSKFWNRPTFFFFSFISPGIDIALKELFQLLPGCTWWVLQLVQSSHLPSASVLFFCLLLLGTSPVKYNIVTIWPHYLAYKLASTTFFLSCGTWYSFPLPKYQLLELVRENSKAARCKVKYAEFNSFPVHYQW